MYAWSLDQATVHWITITVQQGGGYNISIQQTASTPVWIQNFARKKRFKCHGYAHANVTMKLNPVKTWQADIILISPCTGYSSCQYINELVGNNTMLQ